MSERGSERGERPRDGTWRLPHAARRVLASLCRVLCPPHSDALRVTDIGPEHPLIDDIEAAMAALGGPVRSGLLVALTGYDHGALAVHRRRAHKLDPDRAEAYYRSWLALPGPAHEFAQGVKGLIYMAYYEHPAVKQALGYTPEAWIARVTAERHERHAEAIARHRAALLAPDPLPRPRADDPASPPRHLRVLSARPDEDPR